MTSNLQTMQKVTTYRKHLLNVKKPFWVMDLCNFNDISVKTAIVDTVCKLTKAKFCKTHRIHGTLFLQYVTTNLLQYLQKSSYKPYTYQPKVTIWTEGWIWILDFLIQHIMKIGNRTHKKTINHKTIKEENNKKVIHGAVGLISPYCIHFLWLEKFPNVLVYWLFQLGSQSIASKKHRLQNMPHHSLHVMWFNGLF